MKPIRTLARTGATALAVSLAFASVATFTPESAVAARSQHAPKPTPTPTPTPAPVSTAGPTSTALAGYEFAITTETSRSHAEFVVPTPQCTTPGEKAVAFGLAGSAGAAPTSTAVVVVGCHGISAPFALRRATVAGSNWTVTDSVPFGAHVIVERTSSGGNAATTVENHDLPNPTTAERYIMAVGGNHDTSVTYGAFSILGPDSAALEVPAFDTVGFAHNLLNDAALVGGTAVVNAQSNVTTGARNAQGDFDLANRQ